MSKFDTSQCRSLTQVNDIAGVCVLCGRLCRLSVCGVYLPERLHATVLRQRISTVVVTVTAPVVADVKIDDDVIVCSSSILNSEMCLFVTNGDKIFFYLCCL